ncbi:MAG: bifunctional histidinol-phosphatase/imidazoleglycerol-phosphate dehydratase HisB [Flavobacteriales bacterium]|nr:bifunctional histidinol-phosphatase/imidazoleglycerol-phosphate dehydratase HisB [Flavobacteriales bacterium]
MKKILFIDRDGTIIKEPPVDYQVDSLEKLEFVPGVIGALSSICSTTDYMLVMVSNQDGLGTASFPTETFTVPHQKMMTTLEGEGVTFSDVLIDPSMPEDNSPMRKPRTGMVEKYMNEMLDYASSYVIGDRPTDMQLAANMGIKGIVIGSDAGDRGNGFYGIKTWGEILTFLTKGARTAYVSRKTNETDIVVRLDLNGSGKCNVNTGLGFFDHMLSQIAHHGGVDLTIKVKGDLAVDEHHTIEDTAIALGECFAEALGKKKGIERYGFSLPMDETKAEVLLDFSGRAHLEFNTTFDREYVGDFPTEMTKHFFESFCSAAHANMHITASGENTHHVIEGIFKAFARTIKMAIRITGTAIPSSKGTL